MTVAIVGASQAGLQVAASLRERGYAEPIVLIGDEPHAPYQRPPLSKGYLNGTVTTDMLAFRSAHYYAQHAINLITGDRVVQADRSGPTLRTASGREIRFDRLVLATGCGARPLPIEGASLPSVFYLRHLADAQVMSQRLATSSRLVVVGGGFIGLEVAAMAASLGKQVVVLEGTPRLMGRIVGPTTSDFFLRTHQQQGIDIRLNAQVKRIVGTAAGVQAVELADGERIAADMVVVGVGSIPSVALATQLGIAVHQGIVVNERGQTSRAEVLAAGDCAERALPGGGFGRLESVHNAIEQAHTVAATLMGQPPPATKVPWFWSDQGKTKLQMAGLSQGFDQCVVRGDPDSGKFSAFYLCEGVLIAAENINAPGDHMVCRRLIEQRLVMAPEDLADTSIALKDLANSRPRTAAVQ